MTNKEEVLEAASFVINVFNMYHKIYKSFKKLSNDEQKELLEKYNFSMFQGFDYHEDAYIAIFSEEFFENHLKDDEIFESILSKQLIEEREHRTNSLCSHRPTNNKYYEMLFVFNMFNGKSYLSFNDIVEILK